MMQRRKFLQMGSLGAGGFLFSKNLKANFKNNAVTKPLVITTWNTGIDANVEAWKVLSTGGRALDAVEKGVMVTESSINCCVGLGANPDRDGIVTLDASIMDEHGNAGAVAAIERIKHPISVARKVMENTPHVLLVGAGAQEFALSQGFQLEPQKLSPDAEAEYKKWLKTSKYQPVINIEKGKNETKGQTAFAPMKLSNGDWNHDTIGMLAIDVNGNLSGSCTTSGMGFKVRGRVGDSPLIGAGLYVDNEIGAAVSTGLGEEVIKSAGTFLIVEFMRQGYSPEAACKAAVERIVKRTGVAKAHTYQVAFIALNKKGETGAFCVQKGFNYAVYSNEINNLLFDSKYLYTDGVS
ncbi:glycosylasparaginase [Arachidicoccus ginsenosidimutans]|uniref:isoaspartyl peptidase/L-asparaginase family protein n=1 Tax=Arachidicoccus sp. BS20 TaxID=1850526 RepID=UPI0007F175EA|nr:N(4)-(beta-N-acetylglucosaminyl)-L-asparaginase [Arachidicoccus sp. BS20]ANI88455.1 glycosylasparaginase [Arachidicoccus sp. BS20]